MVDQPPIAFGNWVAWSARERPSDCSDVPENFGVFGLYLLGHFPIAAPPAAAWHLSQGVIYVGSSFNVVRRLSRTHEAVRRYRNHFSDSACALLYCAIWNSPWSAFSTHQAKKSHAEFTSLRLLERKLILEYVQQFGHLPALNRE